MNEQLQLVFNAYKAINPSITEEMFLTTHDAMGDEYIDIVNDELKKKEPTEPTTGNPDLTENPTSPTPMEDWEESIPMGSEMSPIFTNQATQQDAPISASASVPLQPSTELPLTDAASSGTGGSEGINPNFNFAETLKSPQEKILAGENARAVVNDTFYRPTIEAAQQITKVIPNTPSSVVVNNPITAQGNIQSNDPFDAVPDSHFEKTDEEKKEEKDFFDKYQPKDYNAEFVEIRPAKFNEFSTPLGSDSKKLNADLLANEKAGFIEIQRKNGIPVTEDGKYLYKITDKNYYDKTYLPYIEKLNSDRRADWEYTNLEKARSNYEQSKQIFDEGGIPTTPLQDFYREYYDKTGQPLDSGNEERLTTLQGRAEVLAEGIAQKKLKENPNTDYQTAYNEALKEVQPFSPEQLTNAGVNLIAELSKGVDTEENTLRIFHESRGEKYNKGDYSEEKNWLNKVASNPEYAQKFADFWYQGGGREMFGASETRRKATFNSQEGRSELFDAFENYKQQEDFSIYEANQNQLNKARQSGKIAKENRDAAGLQSAYQQMQTIGDTMRANKQTSVDKGKLEDERKAAQKKVFRQNMELAKNEAEYSNSLLGIKGSAAAVLNGVVDSGKDFVLGIPRILNNATANSDAVNYYLDEIGKPTQIGNVKSSPIVEKITNYKLGEKDIQLRNGMWFEKSKDGNLTPTTISSEGMSNLKETGKERDFSAKGLFGTVANQATTMLLAEVTGGAVLSGLNKGLNAVAKGYKYGNKLFGRTLSAASEVYGAESAMVKSLQLGRKVLSNPSNNGVAGWTVATLENNYQDAKAKGLTGWDNVISTLTQSTISGFASRISPDVKFFREAKTLEEGLIQAMRSGNASAGKKLVNNFFSALPKAMVKEMAPEVGQEYFERFAQTVGEVINTVTTGKNQVTAYSGEEFLDIAIETAATVGTLGAIGHLRGGNRFDFEGKQFDISGLNRTQQLSLLANIYNPNTFAEYGKNFGVSKDRLAKIENNVKTVKKYIEQIPEREQYTLDGMFKAGVVLQQIEGLKQSKETSAEVFHADIDQKIKGKTEELQAILANNKKENTANENPQPSPQPEATQGNTETDAEAPAEATVPTEPKPKGPDGSGGAEIGLASPYKVEYEGKTYIIDGDSVRAEDGSLTFQQDNVKKYGVKINENTDTNGQTTVQEPSRGSETQETLQPSQEAGQDTAGGLSEVEGGIPENIQPAEASAPEAEVRLPDTFKQTLNDSERKEYEERDMLYKKSTDGVKLTKKESDRLDYLDNKYSARITQFTIDKRNERAAENTLPSSGHVLENPDNIWWRNQINEVASNSDKIAGVRALLHRNSEILTEKDQNDILDLLDSMTNKNGEITDSEQRKAYYDIANSNLSESAKQRANKALIKDAELEQLKNNKNQKKPVETDAPEAEVKSIGTLGDGSNIYLQTDKYRLNDSHDGGYVLNVKEIGKSDADTPIHSEKFSDLNEAKYVADYLEINAPKGVHGNQNAQDLISWAKEEYQKSKNTTNETKQILPSDSEQEPANNGKQLANKTDEARKPGVQDAEAESSETKIDTGNSATTAGRRYQNTKGIDPASAEFEEAVSANNSLVDSLHRQIDAQAIPIEDKITLLGERLSESGMPESDYEYLIDSAEESDFYIQAERKLRDMMGADAFDKYVSEKPGLKSTDLANRIKELNGEEVTPNDIDYVDSFLKEIAVEPVRKQNADAESNTKDPNSEPEIKETIPTSNKDYSIVKTKSGNGYSYEFVSNKTGKIAEPSEKTRQKYLLEHIDRTEYPATDIPEGMHEGDYYQTIATESENPSEIASAIASVPKYKNIEGSKEWHIVQTARRVRPDSYTGGSGDRNKIGVGMAKAYFTRKDERTTSSNTVDIWAKEASASFMNDIGGDEITPDDIADFMERYNNGAEAALRQKNEYHESLVQRFIAVTGLSPTPKVLDHILGKESRDFEREQRAKAFAEKQYEKLSAEQKQSEAKQYEDWFKSLSLEDKQAELIKSYPYDYEQEAAGNIRKPESQSEPTDRRTEGNPNAPNKGTPKTASSPEYRRAFEERDAAEARVKAAQEKLGKVSRETNKNFADDQQDLFGERKSDSKNSLFEERADGEAGRKIIADAKAELDAAREELSDANRRVKGFESGKTEGTGEIQFRIADEKNLVALHNISERNLGRVLNNDAIPVPSIAVVKKGMHFSNFGEVTLIGDVSLGDPKSPKNKIFGGDAYTPRYPRVETSFIKRADEQKFEKEILDLLDDRSNASYINFADVFSGYGDRATEFAYMNEKGVPYEKDNAYKVRSEYFSEIQNRDGFNKWLDEKLSKYPTKEKIFDGYTASGNRRELDHTLENVVKIMTRKTRGGEDFNYGGVAGIRAQATRQFKSVKELKEHSHKIVSSEDFLKIKDEVNAEFDALKDEFRDDIQDHLGFLAFDDMLKDYAKGGKKELAYYLKDEATPEQVSKLNDFLAKLKNLPTEYFEGKPQRAVRINEFAAAVVPENISASVRKRLEEKGIKVYTYKNPAERAAVVERAALENDLLFHRGEVDATPLTEPEFNTLIDRLKKPFAKALKNLKVTTDLEAAKRRAKQLGESTTDLEFKTKSGNVYGFKLSDGTIYFNPKKLNANTAFHEFSHLWEQLMPVAWKKGLSIFRETATGKKIFAELKKDGNYKNLSEEQLWSEAMNTHIGNKGDESYRNPKGKMGEFVQWMKDTFAKIGEVTGVNKLLGRPLTAEDKLGIFTRGVLGDLQGGKTLKAENGAKADGVDFNIAGERGAMVSENREINQRNLANAIRMERSGKSPIEIGITTGWMKGADGKWRVSMDFDASMKPYDFSEKNHTTLGEMLNYPELYDYYPEFEHTRVLVSDDPYFFKNESEQALVTPDGTIVLNQKYFNNENIPEREKAGTILQEVQHLIQRNEGFEEGTNPGRFRNIISDLRRNIERNEPSSESRKLSGLLSRVFGEDWREKANRGEISNEQLETVAYQNAYGEREARAVEEILGAENKRDEFLFQITQANSRGLLMGKGVDFHIIGEKGAGNLDRKEESNYRTDNLATARDMESTGKTDKEIRLATGWERGADGKWRYEIMDGEIKNRERIREVQKNSKSNVKEVDLVSYEINKDGTYKLSLRKKGAKSTSDFLHYNSLRKEDISNFVGEKLAREIISLRGEKLDVDLDFNDGVSYELKGDFEVGSENGLLLSEIVDMPELFHAYPDLKDIPVFFSKDKGGAYIQDKDGKEYIRLNENLEGDTLKRVLTHETHHAIQFREGFAKGGNPNNVDVPKDMVEDISKVESLLRDAIERKNSGEWLYDGLTLEQIIDSESGTSNELKTWAKDIAADGEKSINEFLNDTPFGRYKRLSGEVESRNSEVRANMSAEERRATTLRETEDVAREDQIILMEGSGKMMSSDNSQKDLFVKTTVVPTLIPKSSPIPKSTMMDAINAYRNGGEEKAVEALKESAWFRGLSEGRKANVKTGKFAVLMQESNAIHAERLGASAKAKVEATKKKGEEKVAEVKAKAAEKISDIKDSYMKKIEKLKDEKMDGKAKVKLRREAQKQMAADIKQFLITNPIFSKLTPAQANRLIRLSNSVVLKSGSAVKAFAEFERVYNEIKVDAEAKKTDKETKMDKMAWVEKQISDGRSSGKTNDEILDEIRNHKTFSGRASIAERIFAKEQSKSAPAGEGLKKQEVAFEKEKEALKKQKLNREKAVRLVIQKMTDRQFVPKKLLDEIGARHSYNRMININGASGRASEWMEAVHEKVFRGVYGEDYDALNKIIDARSIVSIEDYMEREGLPPINHHNGMTKYDAQDALSGLEAKLGKEKFDALSKKADEYFGTFHEINDKMLDAGLITPETHAILKSREYSPRFYLEHIKDFEGNIDEQHGEIFKASKGGLSEGVVKGLEEGSTGEKVNDTKFLMSNYLSKMSEAIAMNEVNRTLMTREFPKAKAKWETLQSKPKDKWTSEDIRFDKYFRELQSKLIENPITGVTENGKLKYKEDAAPPGFTKNYYYIDGVKHEFFLADELHEQWNDAFKGLSSEKKEAIKWLSGSKAVKFFATGQNPGFFLSNTPRDFMQNFIVSDQYSANFLVGGFQITRGFLKGALEARAHKYGRAEKDNLMAKYIEYGGSMEFMSQQGMVRGGERAERLGIKMDKAMSRVFGNKADGLSAKIFNAVTMRDLNYYSEVGFRIGMMDRSLSNQIKKYNKDNGTNYKGVEEIPDQQTKDDMYYEAVQKARSILDFSQGGTAVKEAENAMAYLNAATQGSRVFADALKKDPVKVSFKVLQAVAIPSTIAIGAALAVISAFKDDDDKDKSAVDIYLDTLESVSKETRAGSYIIPTGQKDEKGNYKFVNIAITQEIAPLSLLANLVVENILRKSAGRKEIPFSMIAERVNDAVDGAIPINPFHNPFGEKSQMYELGSKIPLAKVMTASVLGIDAYRKDKVSFDVGKVDITAEGMNDSRVDGFYKTIAPKLGMSPARSKVMVENVVTMPTTNPYIAIAYGGMDLVTGNGDKEKLGKTIAKSITKRIYRSGNSYSAVQYKDELNAEEINKAVKIGQDRLNFVNATVKEMLTMPEAQAIEYATKQLESARSNFSYEDRLKIAKSINDKYTKKEASETSSKYDAELNKIKFSKTIEEKAQRIDSYWSQGVPDEVYARGVQLEGIFTKSVLEAYQKIQERKKVKKN